MNQQPASNEELITCQIYLEVYKTTGLQYEYDDWSEMSCPVNSHDEKACQEEKELEKVIPEIKEQCSKLCTEFTMDMNYYNVIFAQRLADFNQVFIFEGTTWEQLYQIYVTIQNIYARYKMDLRCIMFRPFYGTDHKQSHTTPVYAGGPNKTGISDLLDHEKFMNMIKVKSSAIEYIYSDLD